VIHAAIRNADQARREINDGKERYVGLDIGPTGKLLEPMGDLSFDDAYETFKEVAILGEKAGADLIHIETMSDSYELKAAVLAAKENTDLPVFATVIFDEKGTLLTGGDVISVVALLEGLRVDAIGMNCGLGPEQMEPIFRKMAEYASVPLILKPNAGLPKQRDGQTCYDVKPDEFSSRMQGLVEAGACIVGGCCGTTPEHIRALHDQCKDLSVPEVTEKTHTIVSSYGKAVVLDEKPVIIGERINPTGKKRFKQALKEHDLDYVLKEGIEQQEAGAHILDVNVGLPDIDEVAMMEEVVKGLQSITSVPLQIDTVNTAAMERAMRIYNGKPMINSVNGKQECMDEIFPLIAKYGGVVVGLTIDEEGIPKTAKGRFQVAEKIVREAAKYGIAPKNIAIDVLTMTISSEKDGAVTALKALKMVKEKLGVKTVLGVSNISFGLPSRPVINSNFYTLALGNGLDAGIINPKSADMMKSYDAYCALMGYDDNCTSYISRYSQQEETTSVRSTGSMDLKKAIEKGLKDDAESMTKELLKEQDPLDIINTFLIPALDTVGKGFEKGTVFLPQLLMSADAAKAAFGVLKDSFAGSEDDGQPKNIIALATVQGDIHDIGKNIVKVLLENYQFQVIDLGKDVPPETVLEAVQKHNITLVGLSALMTTTVTSMEATIKLLKEHAPECKVMVGGAVLNQEYADMIGADFYGKDAMQSVHYAQEHFGIKD
jgi:5-methyltetrahydrofolate--homocysteine methyltransferase